MAPCITSVSECSAGEWGADCASCCHCGEGTCHPLTGECPKGCAECWMGGNCQTSMLTSFWFFHRFVLDIQPKRWPHITGTLQFAKPHHLLLSEKENCHARASAQCAPNAISFTDYDRCGEPLQRCQCLSGFTGDGYKNCHGKALTLEPNLFFAHCIRVDLFCSLPKILQYSLDAM